MSDVPFKLKAHARGDLEGIRKYTIKKWDKTQWIRYKTILYRRLQSLANNPQLGLTITDISDNAYRFPDGHHVFYYLKRPKDVVFVGVLSSSMAPDKHLIRKKDIESELKF